MAYSKEEILNSFPLCDRWCSRCRNLDVYYNGDGYICKHQFGDKTNQSGITILGYTDADVDRPFCNAKYFDLYDYKNPYNRRIR
ncbi:MAG: hypothetical protein E7314_01220 [Clostridiales bacterium]|nr:hypothetical protein [Clostridiales bacterium]